MKRNKKCRICGSDDWEKNEGGNYWGCVGCPYVENIISEKESKGGIA